MEVVDGLDDSLYYPDEELDLTFCIGTPLQKSIEKVDVFEVDTDITKISSVRFEDI